MEVDISALLRAAQTAGVADSLPSCLRFERSEPVSLPASAERFDVVVTWSVFEHVDDRPIGLLRTSDA